MKKYLLLISSVLFLISCDDGDLIVTEFAFEDQQLNHCGTEDTQVLFNINNDEVFESIALIFSMNETQFLELEAPVEIPLNQNNFIVYRTFDSQVDDYYCSEVPPASPEVVEEFRSTSGGVVTITPQLRNINDHDDDGVPSSEEMETQAEFAVDGFPDTDGDGIPNYLDIDDDGDNVTTIDEIDADSGNSMEKYFDTDGDGTPDYLDEDDDGDETITRYEDLNENADPTDDVNDENLPNYLNPDIVDEFIVDIFLNNTITESYRLEVAVDNLTLKNQSGGGEEITMLNYILGYFDTPAVTIDLSQEEEGENEEEETEAGPAEE